MPGERNTQYENFANVARELKTDESEAAFDQVLRKVGGAKPDPEKKKPGTKAGSRKSSKRT